MFSNRQYYQAYSLVATAMIKESGVDLWHKVELSEGAIPMIFVFQLVSCSAAKQHKAPGQQANFFFSHEHLASRES
jgi:hypothetical protein